MYGSSTRHHPTSAPPTLQRLNLFFLPPTQLVPLLQGDLQLPHLLLRFLHRGIFVHQYKPRSFTLGFLLCNIKLRGESLNLSREFRRRGGRSLVSLACELEVRIERTDFSGMVADFLLRGPGSSFRCGKAGQVRIRRIKQVAAGLLKVGFKNRPGVFEQGDFGGLDVDLLVCFLEGGEEIGLLDVKMSVGADLGFVPCLEFREGSF